MKSGAQDGFSIVEMIAVIGIALVLGAIALPMLSQTRALRENTVCVSNLRQIGLGILAYAHDNNDLLPGPLLSGQYPYWGHYSQLSYHLADYLNLDKTDYKTGYKDVFVCPAYARVSRNVGDYQVYGMNIQVKMEGKSRPQQPFGYANLSDPRAFNTIENFPPMKLAELANICDEEGRPARTSTWAMMDADQLDGRFQGLPVSANRLLPSFPVHGAHRNALFFDFHVAAIKATP